MFTSSLVAGLLVPMPTLPLSPPPGLVPIRHSGAAVNIGSAWRPESIAHLRSIARLSAERPADENCCKSKEEGAMFHSKNQSLPLLPT